MKSWSREPDAPVDVKPRKKPGLTNFPEDREDLPSDVVLEASDDFGLGHLLPESTP